MRRALLVALACAIGGFAGSAGAQPTSVAADVVADTTWGGAANPCPIILQQPIFVKGGATLTILPGCIVRGQPRTGAVTPGIIAGSPGALVVTQNGQLVANGTATSPIVFTTAATDNNNDGIADGKGSACSTCADPWNAGDVFLDDTPTTAPLAPLDKAGTGNVSLWGGLVVLGNAPTNLDDGCGLALKGQCTVEGLTIPGFPIADATYGGLLPHDSSGSIQYVSVRHAGDEIGSGNELNGITLAGVGDGTTLRFVEVYVNFDDGIEWFGGTVNGSNLATFFVGDDNFDLDQGYTGSNQFLFGIMPFFNENSGAAFGSASGDKGGEWDGDDAAEVGGVCTLSDGTCRPLSNPAMYNLTILGSTLLAGNDFTPVSTASANRGVQFRNGFAGELLNSIIVNTGSAQAFDVDTAGTQCGAPYDMAGNITACRAQVLATTLDNSAGMPATEQAALDCGNADVRVSCPGTGCNVVNAAAFPGLVDEDTSFNPTGDAAGKLVASLKPTPINPRPKVGLTGVAGGAVPPLSKGLDPSATYRGAFSRTATTLWTTDWTTLNVAGLLAD